MLSSLLKQVHCGKTILRSTSALLGCRSFATESSEEYEIIVNMKTYPLFEKKIEVVFKCHFLF